MKYRVLVTGSEGFIGREVCAKLERCPEIVHIERMDVMQEESNRIYGNVILWVDVMDKAERAFVRKWNGEKDLFTENVIIHLAGHLGTSELNGHNSAVRAVETNVIGTVHALEAARRYDARMIMIGKPNVWCNTYTITKVAAQSFTQMYVKEYGIPAIILAPFNVFGPGQPLAPYRKAVPYMIKEARAGEPMTVYGDGTNTVDMVWVGDVAECIVRATMIVPREKCIGAVWDVGTGVEMTVNDMARSVATAVKTVLGGEEVPIKHVPMRSGETDQTRLVADTDHIRRFLNFVPNGMPNIFAKRLQATVEWYNAVWGTAHVGTTKDYAR